jgi:hypothetical protein
MFGNEEGEKQVFAFPEGEEPASPSPARLSGNHLEVEDKRELRLEVLDQLVVRGDEFTILLLCQGNVQAVVDANAGFGRDVTSPEQEGKGGVEPGQRAEHVGQERDSRADRDAFLPLGTGERVPNLDGEHIGSQQLVDALLEVRAQLSGLVGKGSGTAHLKATDESMTYFMREVRPEVRE